MRNERNAENASRTERVRMDMEEFEFLISMLLTTRMCKRPGTARIQNASACVDIRAVDDRKEIHARMLHGA